MNRRRVIPIGEILARNNREPLPPVPRRRGRHHRSRVPSTVSWCWAWCRVQARNAAVLVRQVFGR